MVEIQPEPDDAAQNREPAEPMRVRDIPADLAWKLAGAIAVALVAGFLLLDLVHIMIRPLGILLAAIVVAMALAPIVNALERWVPRLLGIVLVYLALALILVGFGMMLIPPLISQATNLVENMPDHAEQMRDWFERYENTGLPASGEQLSGVLEPAAGLLIEVPTVIVLTGLEIMIAAFVSLYWLHSMPRLKAFTVSLFAPLRQPQVETVLGNMGERMGGYVRGVVIAGTVVAAAVYVGLNLLGIQYALLLAMVSFLGEFFPNVGPVLAAIPAVIIALFHSPQLALIVILFYIGIQQVESLILTPFIMRGQAHVPPLVATFAVFTGFVVGGVLWALLAIPVAGAAMVLVTDVIAPSIRRRSGSESLVVAPALAGAEARHARPQPRPNVAEAE
jgi:predicted PurR-regulated permease PerM